MEDVKKCNVFISSPGDLMEEREYIAKYLEQMEHPKVVFNPIRWEKDLPNTSKSTPQDLINEELLKRSDILIGIFATKFGSKTEHADSGTVEEIETFIAQGKPVILYFYDVNISTENLSVDELKNLIKIKEFKEKYATKHIYTIIKGKSELTDALARDINYNMKLILDQTSSSKTTTAKPKSSQTRNTLSGRNTKKGPRSKGTWYMDSIADLINNYIKKKGMPFHYQGSLTFHENSQFLIGTTNYTTFVEQKILEEARIDAFNQKYGNYDYSEDLRDRFPEWGSQIRDRILKLNPNIISPSMRVLDVGGNDGSELLTIFHGYSDIHFTVVDISNVAIDNGKAKYKNIEFIQSDMESEYLSNVPLFDVCLCLRSIQSRGVFSHDAIIQMCKHLNSDGILIISIPNGYKHSDKIERGLYDHRSRQFLRTKPQELAAKIERKLIDYGFVDTGIETIDTEIVVWGKGRGIK